MQFFAFGVNHESASLEVCEAFALDAGAQQAVYAAAPPAELVLLSTCNRTEVYGYGTPEQAQAVRMLLAQRAGRDGSPEEGFYLTEEAAVRHVLQVAAGLRSMVPGDAQILAQMKEAYRRAVEAGTVDMALHRLMHTAFRAAKRVARETALSSGAASVSTAAVALAQRYFERRGAQGLEARRVLLVGAGQMGRLALGALRSHHPSRLFVANRSAGRAEEVARQTGAKQVPWQERHEAAARADLVFVATGAARPVLHAEALPDRSGAEADTLIIDIAMPRNVDPAIGGLAGYAVKDLGALQDWTERVEQARRAELPIAEHICEELLADYVSWVFHQEALQPAIQAIRSTFDTIRRQEIERHAHRFDDLDRAELDRLTESILQKILAVPIVRLKNVEPEHIDYARGIRLLSALFSRPDCEEDEEAPSPEEPEENAAFVNAPAACPFETHAPLSERDVEQIREALRAG